MQPLIKTTPAKKLIGKRLTMSLAEDRTGELWRNFMPVRHNIQGRIGESLYSLQVYDPSYFGAFHPGRPFEKWAAVEVETFESIPSEMESLVLPEGLYAVFLYKGSSKDSTVYNYIFTSWLPGSGYALDTRPHFERLGPAYKNGSPDSEEEIWIPIQPNL